MTPSEGRTRGKGPRLLYDHAADTSTTGHWCNVSDGCMAAFFTCVSQEHSPSGRWSRMEGYYLGPA